MSVFAALRVYAIFHRKRWVFGVVLVTGLVNPIILFVSNVLSPIFNWLTDGIVSTFSHDLSHPEAPSRASRRVPSH